MNNTLQKNYPELAKKIGLPNLWIKHEYLNESGSHKIRLIKFLVDKNLKQNKKTFVISSSGNAAIAAAYYFNKYVKKEFSLMIFVSKNIDNSKIKRLTISANKNKNIKIKKVARPKQSAFLWAKKNQAVFLRGSIEPNAPKSYFLLAKELLKIPNLKAVFIPTSSGITALGLHQGFSAKGGSAKSGKKIEIHIVQTEKINFLAREFDHDFKPSNKSLAGAIVDKVAFQKSSVLKMIKESCGSGWIISDKLLKKTKKLARDNGLPMVSYDALLSLAGLIKAKEKKWPLTGAVCCIFTGR